MLTIEREVHHLSLPPIPDRLSTYGMPTDEDLAEFLDWVHRAARLQAGRRTSQRNVRRKMRSLAKKLIAANDAGDFELTWQYAAQALPDDLFKPLVTAA